MLLFAAVLAVSSLSAAPEADWSQFRGSDGSSVSRLTGLPTTWSETDGLAWKLDLPGPGSSSPIVSGDLVFVTCYSGYGVDRGNPGEVKSLVRHVFAARRTDGSIAWKKDVPAEVEEDGYQGFMAEHGYASSTPAADGQRLYVFFGKSGVLAFDRDGKQLWKTSVGTGSGMNGWGSAASPVLHKNLVIVNANAEGQAVVALDKETGREVWKAPASGYRGSWSTPSIVTTAKGTAELVLVLPGELWGLDPSDGGLLWHCGEFGSAPSNTTVAAKDGVVYALAGGRGGSAAVAIRTGGRGDVTASHVVWKSSLGSYVPSPLIVADRLHWVDDRGTAQSLKLDTGAEVYRGRLNDSGGVYASPVAADGKIYVVTRRNGTIVLADGAELKELARNKLASDSTDFNASPAIAPGQLLLRSNKALYCIGKK